MKATKKFYYLRDVKNRPIVTVCCAKRGTKFSRGISVCSEYDNPCKAVGRAIANDRVNKAMGLKRDESWTRVSRTAMGCSYVTLLCMQHEKSPDLYMGLYDVTPNAIEKKIFKIRP